MSCHRIILCTALLTVACAQQAPEAPAGPDRPPAAEAPAPGVQPPPADADASGTPASCTEQDAEAGFMTCSLGTLKANLSGEDKPGSLAVDITLELKASDAQALQAKDAAVREAIKAVIANTAQSEAGTEDGLRRVRDAMHRSIDQTLAPAVAERVYFTQLTVTQPGD